MAGLRHPTRQGQTVNPIDADRYHNLFVTRYPVWSSVIQNMVNLADGNTDIIESHIRSSIMSSEMDLPGESKESLIRASLFELDYQLQLSKKGDTTW